MIPIKLTIEGLYSYQERQSIDFSELTCNGLFGILGGVGSGKSSILEAITYALYGETERLNVRDKRAYNMLNLKSNRAWIEFDFHNHENRIFRAVRELRRNSKNFDDVKTQQVVFYEYKNESWEPLEHTDAEKLIGLSYNNFKRTIIIPQGQFKEFLELGAKDRTNMMKEIFQLHRYDLQDKVASLRSTNKSNLDQIYGRLMEYESVNDEDVKTKTDQLKELTVQFENTKKEHKLLDDKYQQWKGLKDSFLKLQENKINFEEMQKQLPEVEQKQLQLQTYERLFSKFDRLIADFKRSAAHAKAIKQDYEEIFNKFNLLSGELKSKNDELDKIKPQFNNLAESRKKEADLGLISQIINYRIEIENLQKRQINGAAMVEEATRVLQQITDEIKLHEEELKSLSEKKYDSKLLVDLDGWYVQMDNHKKMIEQYQKTFSQKQNEFEDLLKEMSDKNIDIDNFEAQFQRALNDLKKREALVNEHKSNFELKQKMTDYANSLHDGMACPLCGSTEHPNIADVEDVSQHLAQVSNELQQISLEHEQLLNNRAETIRLLEKMQRLQTEVEEAEKVLKNEKEAIQLHESKFIWNEFNADNRADFEENKKQSFEIEKEISDKNKKISLLRSKESEQREKLELYVKGLDKLKSDEDAFKVKAETNQSLLKVLNVEDFSDRTTEWVDAKALQLKNENDTLETNYNHLNERVIELDKQKIARQTDLNNLEKQLTNNAQELDALNIAIDEQLEAEGFENLKSVEEILASKLDVHKIREEIQKFKTRISVLSDRIATLEEELNKMSYDDALFDKYEIEWKLSKEKLEIQNDAVVKLRLELENLIEKLKEKADLLIEHDKLIKRAENLNLMYNLFRGQGFVQYVSSIYLAQLCDHANERFRRMTRNQLRLQINENNDFEIVDYLNEGRTRSVKTLSGGQSFQVSLSLALALAESVQSNAKADKNFFFIDEGFGTQDLDSVNIVFETLLNLNKENKIVGIISHVEELKERIPMTLTIVKDAERGSLIYMQK